MEEVEYDLKSYAGQGLWPLAFAVNTASKVCITLQILRKPNPIIVSFQSKSYFKTALPRKLLQRALISNVTIVFLIMTRRELWEFIGRREGGGGERC